MGVSDHLFADMMAGKSSGPSDSFGRDTAWNFTSATSAALSRGHSGILNSSVLPLSSPSVSPQTVPQVTPVTAGGTVMFELESLVIQHFGSRHAYSSWHSIAEFRAGIPTRSPRTNFCWTSWALSFRRETRTNCSLWKLARLRTPKTKKAERLTAATVRHFKDMMATCRQSGITREESGKSSYVQWAIRQLWRKYGVGLHPRNFSSGFMTVGDGRRCGHTLASSFLQCRHVRNSAFTRVTANGTVIFELRRAS